MKNAAVKIVVYIALSAGAAGGSALGLMSLGLLVHAIYGQPVVDLFTPSITGAIIGSVLFQVSAVLNGPFRNPEQCARDVWMFGASFVAIALVLSIVTGHFTLEAAIGQSLLLSTVAASASLAVHYVYRLLWPRLFGERIGDRSVYTVGLAYLALTASAAAGAGLATVVANLAVHWLDIPTIGDLFYRFTKGAVLGAALFQISALGARSLGASKPCAYRVCVLGLFFLAIGLASAYVSGQFSMHLAFGLLLVVAGTAGAVYQMHRILRPWVVANSIGLWAAQ